MTCPVEGSVGWWPAGARTGRTQKLREGWRVGWREVCGARPTARNALSRLGASAGCVDIHHSPRLAWALRVLGGDKTNQGAERGCDERETRRELQLKPWEV